MPNCLTRVLKPVAKGYADLAGLGDAIVLMCVLTTVRATATLAPGGHDWLVGLHNMFLEHDTDSLWCDEFSEKVNANDSTAGATSRARRFKTDFLYILFSFSNKLEEVREACRELEGMLQEGAVEALADHMQGLELTLSTGVPAGRFQACHKR